MKNAKILVVILAVCLTITALASCTTTYGELKLTQTQIVSCKYDRMSVTSIIDYEKSNISKNNVVIVNSSNEKIAKCESNSIVFGGEYGEATLEIIVGNKRGTVKVKVVPYTQYLYAIAEKEGASGFDKINYYASTWLISNLSVFKNPSSVSVEDILYVENTINSTEFNANYLIMEIRAQNGFGGNSISYFKVSPGGIEEVTVKSYGGISKSYNGLKLYSISSYSVNKAIQEYISENY